MRPGIFAMLLVGLSCGNVAAQDVDVEALKVKMAERADNYSTLVDILEGVDENAALAAFDVMLESGNKTLAEMAINSALAAADTRLRARALWEVLARRDSLVLEIDTHAMKQDEEALAQLRKWIGPMQSVPLLEKFPETQCINIRKSDSCNHDFQVSISGLKVDIRDSNVSGSALVGSFILSEDGVLHGSVKPLRRDFQDSFPASITLR